MRFHPSLFLTVLFVPLASALTLEEALAAALADNPTEAAARARLEQAEARLQQTRAAYQPRLTLEAGGTHIRLSDRELERTPGLPGEFEQYQAGLQASLLLFDGGERRGRTRAAAESVEAARAARDLTLQELTTAVSRTYVAAQTAREAVRIAEADEAFNQRQLEETNQRREAGQSALADSLNFEIRLQQAVSARVNAQRDVELLLSTLGTLMALEGPAPEPVAPVPEPPPELPRFEDAWPGAESRLPEIRLARATLAASESRARASRGERIPNLSLFGSVEARREDDPNFAGDDVGQTVGVVLSHDLWDGDARRQRRREAEAQVAEARAEVRRAELEARDTLRQSLSRLQAAITQSEIRQRTLELTRQNRDLIETSHRAGTESLLRLNEAQRDFLNAESRAAQARLELKNAEIDFLRAIGE